ncbi:MAG: hypothetical protein ABI591_05605 [Kofleriaceae bacterium]
MASLLVLVSACGGARFRAEHAGNGVALVTPRGAPAAPSAGIPVGQGAYDVHLHFDMPRAQLVEWHVQCPGTESQGSLGEPFEAYRTRRLAQLKAERERDRQTAGAVTSLLVGAIAPNVSAQGQAGPVRADAQVSGQVVGDAAGTAVANSIDMKVELAPGDVGGGPVETVVHVVTTAPGACVVSAVADDPNVGGRFELVHIRDLEAEARTRDVAIDHADIHARAVLTTQLVAFGGDPALRQKQRDAAAQAHAAAEAKAGAEASARAEASLVIERQHEAEANAHAEASLVIERQHAAAALELEQRQLRIAMDVRVRWRLLLISWGAEVDYRARMRAQAGELEARRLRIAMEVRARWRVLLISWGADVEYRAKLEARARIEHDRRIAELAAADAELARRQALAIDLAMRARIEMRAYLVAMGARERPPMPELRTEIAGTAPFDGATWIAGHWTWTGVEWSWSAGGWTDRSVTFGESGGEAPVQGEAPAMIVVETPPPVVVDAPVITTTVSMPTIVVHDHRTVTAPPPPVRDHRTVSAPVRDHRSSPPPSSDKPKVRDHR